MDTILTQGGRIRIRHVFGKSSFSLNIFNSPVSWNEFVSRSEVKLNEDYNVPLNRIARYLVFTQVSILKVICVKMVINFHFRQTESWCEGFKWQCT